MRNVALAAMVATLVASVSGYCQAASEAEPALTGIAPLQIAQLPTTPEGKVRIRSVRITGATVFPADELRAFVASAEGQELTLAEIQQLVARITAHYRRRGYLVARAYVPPQRIEDGILEIAVLEGRVGKVQVQGAKRYSPDLLQAYVAPPKEQPVFNAPQHESGMLRLNDLPGLRVESTLKPGAEVGTTDVILDVVKDRLITGSIETNNYGSRLTGRYRLGLSLDLNNPTGLGDVLSVRGVGAVEQVDDTWFARAGYTLPVGMLGTKIGAAYTHAEAAVGREFAVLGINGTGDLVSVFLAHPFIRTQALSLFGQLGFDYKEFETRALNQTVNEDTVSVLNLGGIVEIVDGWRGLTSGMLSVHRGIPEFLGSMQATDDPDASRTGAGGEFTKLVGSAARLQQVYGPTSLFARATGQWTDDKLVTAEQFIAGGAGIVRGYPIGEITGDLGLTLTGEFRWNAPGFSDVPTFGGKTWGDLLQVFAFIDYGEVRILDPLPGQDRHRDIAGTGVGFRLGYPNVFQLSVEYAHPIGPRPSDRVDEFVYFQTVAWF
jgi:hemolysin activation/secretion protein